MPTKALLKYKMAAPAKYRQVFQEMIRHNQALFDSFTVVYQKYSLDPKKYQAEFNLIGEKVLDTIRYYENRLCRHSENSGFGKFSGGLSSKFWEEIHRVYPKIDEIGVK